MCVAVSEPIVNRRSQVRGFVPESFTRLDACPMYVWSGPVDAYTVLAVVGWAVLAACGVLYLLALALISALMLVRLPLTAPLRWDVHVRGHT